MDTDVLTQLIDAKLGLLTQLRGLATKHAELLESADISRVMRYLAAKQRLLSAVEEIETKLDPFRGEDPEQRQWRSPEHRLRAQEASARCDALLREIIAMEKQGETQLTQRRDDAADQLRGIHHSRRIASAYLATPDSSGHQFDASCET